MKSCLLNIKAAAWLSRPNPITSAIGDGRKRVKSGVTLAGHGIKA